MINLFQSNIYINKFGIHDKKVKFSSVSKTDKNYLEYQRLNGVTTDEGWKISVDQERPDAAKGSSGIFLQRTKITACKAGERLVCFQYGSDNNDYQFAMEDLRQGKIIGAFNTDNPVLANRIKGPFGLNRETVTIMGTDELERRANQSDSWL